MRTSRIRRLPTALGAVLAAVATLLVAAPATADREDTVLTTGERLDQGDSLVSPDGRYRLQLDHFGGLTLQERPNWINGSPEVWHSFADDAEFVVLQADGNLVAYRDDLSVAWDFGTAGSGATQVRLQTDRNLVFLAADGSVVADAATYGDVVLSAGQHLLPGDVLRGEDGVSRLLMQPDGNLVLYRGATALWSSGTHGNPGAGAYFQGDGNLVVYSSAETGRRPLADTGTWRAFLGTDPATTPRVLVVEDTEVSVVRLSGESGVAVWGSGWGSDRLLTGDELDPGDRRTSRGGTCTLVMQPDQNLVEYCAGRAVFATGVPSILLGPGLATTAYAVAQADGNVVVYQTTQLPGGPSRALFATGTRGAGHVLVVQDDRNLVVYAPGGRAVWSRLTGPR